MPASVLGVRDTGLTDKPDPWSWRVAGISKCVSEEAVSIGFSGTDIGVRRGFGTLKQ